MDASRSVWGAGHLLLELVHTMPLSNQPDVSILIVSYNTRELTLAAIDSVVRETSANCEIIVVDNASNDGSAEAIAEHPAGVKLVALNENVGFGRANNLAAQHAHADHLLLLNPDTVVLYHAIDRLLEFAHQTPAALIWGGRTVFPDGTLNPASCWQRISLWNQVCRVAGLAALFPNSSFFNDEAIGGWQRDSVREVDIVSGCFLMIRRALWDKLRGFDPIFHMYGEEADLCLRARAFGAQPIVTPGATIIHLGGASESTRPGKLTKLLAAKVSLVKRHVAPGTRFAARNTLLLWPLSRWLALSIAGALTANGKLAASAADWGSVWKQRESWRHGYDVAQHVLPRAGNAAAGSR